MLGKKRLSISDYIRTSTSSTLLDEVSHREFITNIASMKEKVERESDYYFLISLGLSGLYLLKYLGITFNLKIFGAEILSVDDPLFALAVLSLTLLTLSAMRAADSAYYERVLDELCSKMWPQNAKLATLSTYGGNGLHHNILDIPIGKIDSLYDRVLLALSRFGVGIIVMLFAIGPILIGGSFLYKKRAAVDAVDAVQFYTILVLSVSALIEGLLALRFAERERPAEANVEIESVSCD